MASSIAALLHFLVIRAFLRIFCVELGTSMSESTTGINTAAPPANFNGDSGNNIAAPPKLNGLSVEKATKNVHTAIRGLLTDEFPDLAKRNGSRMKSGGQQYLRLTITTMKNYFKAIWKTWWGVVYSFGKMFVGGVCKSCPVYVCI